MPTSTVNPTVVATAPQGVGQENLSSGLTSDEARKGLAEFGPNAMPDTAIRPWSMALAKLMALGRSYPLLNWFLVTRWSYRSVAWLPPT
jgi:hypothetical protein